MALALTLVLTGIFNNMENDMGVLVSMLAFIGIYQNTSGPIAWLYATETTIDTALGICLFTLWGTTFLVSLLGPILMSSDALGISNVFFLFAALSFCGTIYGYFFIKETKGLTDKEKKRLYYPAEYFEEEIER